jgi:hypothetical protein
MNKDQERSFVARLSSDFSNMSFFDQQLDSNLFNSSGFSSPYPPNIITTNEFVLDGKLFPVANDRRTPKLIVHFRCYDDYYNLQILNEPYSLKYFSKDSQGILGAFPAAGGETTSFNLLDDNHNIITLDDLASNEATIYLKARNAEIIKKSIWGKPINKAIFTDKSGDISAFQLTILEREVATPKSPADYA